MVGTAEGTAHLCAASLGRELAFPRGKGSPAGMKHSRGSTQSSPGGNADTCAPKQPQCLPLRRDEPTWNPPWNITGPNTRHPDACDIDPLGGIMPAPGDGTGQDPMCVTCLGQASPQTWRADLRPAGEGWGSEEGWPWGAGQLSGQHKHVLKWISDRDTALRMYSDTSRHTCSGWVVGYVSYVSIKSFEDRRGRACPACPALCAGREAPGQAHSLSSGGNGGARGGQLTTQHLAHASPGSKLPGWDMGPSRLAQRAPWVWRFPSYAPAPASPCTNQQNLGSHESREVGGGPQSCLPEGLGGGE